jgi:hypothetical protein
MVDPARPRKSLKDAFSEVATFDFFTEVYPSSIMSVII